MTLKSLLAELDAGRPARVPAAAWKRLAKRFVETAVHDTRFKGALRLGDFEGRLVAVEEPDAELRAVRAFPDPAAADAFVRDRMAAYDRFWDG